MSFEAVMWLIAAGIGIASMTYSEIVARRAERFMKRSRERDEMFAAIRSGSGRRQS